MSKHPTLSSGNLSSNQSMKLSALMMHWIENLDQHNHNPFIAALARYAKQGIIPQAIVQGSKDNTVGCEFYFESEESYFVSVMPDMLDKHWEEVQAITAKYPQLGSITYNDGRFPFGPDDGIPFDPEEGLLFRIGRIFGDRIHQINAFKEAVDYQLPTNFLEMLGEYCEGGFDGYYSVHYENDVEVMLVHLLLIKLADEHDRPEHDVIRLIHEKPNLFGTIGSLKLFPFGEAWIVDRATDYDDARVGYLTFDVEQDNAVVCLSESGDIRINIATSFRQMMLDSKFVFF